MQHYACDKSVCRSVTLLLRVETVVAHHCTLCPFELDIYRPIHATVESSSVSCQVNFLINKEVISDTVWVREFSTQ